MNYMPGFYLLQKLLRILAAFSHSLSIVSGKKLSEPSLFASMLKGVAALPPQALKRWPHPAFLGAPSLSGGGTWWAVCWVSVGG